MSLPVQDCLFFRAARGDEKAFDHLVKRLAYNLVKGHFTMYPCNHEPSCPECTEEELAALHDRLFPALQLEKEKIKSNGSSNRQSQ